MLITPEQIRAARALLRLKQEELARRARVSVATVRRLEGPRGAEEVGTSTAAGIRRVLEEAGAEFIADGVRRRHPRREDPEALFKELRAISERSAAYQTTLTPLTEADLYDENGLPR
jgi:transcriptional regulator with XRE-family HTH domain